MGDVVKMGSVTERSLQSLPPRHVMCVSAHVLEHESLSAAVRLEDSTSPPPPVSSSCSLLSGGTRGAGLNYGKEVDCDTDAGHSNGVSSPGGKQGTPRSVLPYPETMRAIADHLLLLPSQQSWTQEQISLCMCVQAASASLLFSYSHFCHFFSWAPC